MGLRSESSFRIAAALLITMTLACCALSLIWTDDSAADVKASGTCGPLTWTLDDIGKMIISGDGDMDFSETSGEAPWEGYKPWIVSVTIGSGVTSICDGAFDECTSLFEVINLSALNIQKRSEDNGRVAYYAKVVTTTDESKVGSLDDVCIYGYDDEYAYLIKYIGDSTVLELPEDVDDGEYIICTDFFTSDELDNLIFPDDVLYIEIDAFGDIVFYDSDGETEIPPTAENLKGHAFANQEGKMVKYTPNTKKNRELPPIVLWITGILSIGILIHAVRRN